MTTLDEKLPVANLVVGLQEYGVTNRSLMAGLEARGAKVDAVRVYEWDLPDDCGPLEANIRRIVAGEVDVAMFTSANQVVNLLKLADDLGLADDLRAAMRHVVVASIGPTTSEMLRSQDLPVDLEPSHPKMGQLVLETAEKASGACSRGSGALRRQSANFGVRSAECGVRSENATPHSTLRHSTLALRRHAVHARVPARADRLHAGLADAASGPLHARVSRDSRAA